MRTSAVVSRDGPSLIGLMARSAVISSVPALRPDRQWERRRRPRLAPDRYLQLYELMEAGVLTRHEFTVAANRFTAQLARRPERVAEGDAPTGRGGGPTRAASLR
jgi:hypothetical protein